MKLKKTTPRQILKMFFVFGSRKRGGGCVCVLLVRLYSES